MNTAARLRRARQEAGLTQVELARLTAMKQSVISAYESGKRIPSEASCRRVLEATGIRPSLLLKRHRAQMLAVLEERGVTDVRFFGSTARGDDDAASDLDLLVKLPPRTTLFDVVEITYAVEDVVGVDVDLVSERSLQPSKPSHRKMLEQAVPV